MSQPIPNEPRPGLVGLRAAVPADAEILCHWRREASVRRFQPLTEIGQGQLRAELAGQRMDALYRGQGDKFQWIITHDGEAAGWITLVVANWDHGLAEIGYALGTRWQRRRIMPAALDQLLAELFCRTALERIEARCDVDNVASQKVLERIGFRREGRLRGFFVLGDRRVDNHLYAILRSDWLPSGRGAGPAG